MTVIQMPNPEKRQGKFEIIYSRNLRRLTAFVFAAIAVTELAIYIDKKIIPEHEAAQKVLQQMQEQVDESFRRSHELYEATRKEVSNFERARLAYISAKENYDLDQPVRGKAFLNSYLANDIKKTVSEFFTARVDFRLAAILTFPVLENFCKTERSPYCSKDVRDVMDRAADVNLRMVQIVEDTLQQQDAVEIENLSKRPGAQAQKNQVVAANR